MANVYIVEHPRNNIDVSKAKAFGNIKYLFDNDDRRCSAWDTELFGQTILKRLHELKYKSSEDCICIVGAMLIVVNSVVAISQHYKAFNLLLFNSVENKYVLKTYKRK